MRVNKFIAFATLIGICFGSRADIVVEVEHPDGSVEILLNPKVAPAPVLLKKAEGDSETNLKLKEFNRIVIGQGIEVNYTIGGSNEMQVYAPATLLENLSAKVRKGVLTLESLGEATGTVKINLSAPEVKTITLTGNAVLAFVSGKVHHGKLEANSSSHINASGMVSDSLKKIAMPLSTID